MDFKKATDDLFSGVDHAKLAKELGVSIASIRQARLNPAAKAHRTPPGNWEISVARLAEERAAHYMQLSDKIKISNKNR